MNEREIKIKGMKDNSYKFLGIFVIIYIALLFVLTSLFDAHVPAFHILMAAATGLCCIWMCWRAHKAVNG